MKNDRSHHLTINIIWKTLVLEGSGVEGFFMREK